MAAAPSRDRDDASYNEGGQGYGKSRKRPFRRTTQSTPYDRPPTAVRNANISLNSQGWLSKLVDPAQRLITSSAYRLFGSVFRKRLGAPPSPQPPEQPESSRGGTDKQLPPESVPTDHIGKEGEAVYACDNPSNTSRSCGVSDLELILKQKTFTRSEIDHLTSVLLSRVPDGDEERRPELIHSRATMPQDKKEFLYTPLRDNGVDRNRVSAPVPDSRVLDEDVASPAELAKTYMGSRPLMGSPLKQGSHYQPSRENSNALISHPSTSKSPMLSVVPSSSGRAGFAENGFLTPRARGRTAIYSMARTPYSRVCTATSLQNSGVTPDAFGELPLSSPSPWENNRSGSKQGALKRRISVLDNDIRSVGPIRRIRQKSNLLPSSRTLSIRGAGFGPGGAQNTSPIEKPVSAGEPSTGNRDNNIHGSGLNPVSSKSREVASKILQQLDVLVSSREKSPSKLSPSMLSGPALRSLENVDSSKLLDNLDAKHGNLLPDVKDTQPQKQDKLEQNGMKRPIASYEKSASLINGADSTDFVKKDGPSLLPTVAPLTNAVSRPSLQRKRGFQMSAHEDFLELDDDDNTKGALPATFSGRSKKLDTVLAENGSAVDAGLLEKPPAVSEPVSTEKSSGLTVPITPPTVTVQQAMVDSRSTSLSDKAVLLEKSDAAPVFSFGEKVIAPKAQDLVSPSLDSRRSNGSEAPPFKFSPPVAERDSTGLKSGDLPDSKWSGLRSASAGAAATDSVPKESGMEKADTKNNMNVGFFGRSPEPAFTAVATTSSTANIFSFGIAASSTLNNSSSASTPPISFSSPSLLSNKISQNSFNSSSGTFASSISDATAVTTTTANASSSGSLSTSASVPAPLFKFGSSLAPPTSVSSGPATDVIESTEAKTKKANFGELTNAPFGGTSSAITSMAGTSSSTTDRGGNTFGGSSGITSIGDTSSAITSTGGNVFGGSSANTNSGISIFSSAPSTSSGSSFAVVSSGVTTAASPIFGFNSGVTASSATNQSESFNPFGASSALTGLGASTESMPLQFSSSASSSSSGFAGTTTFPFGSSNPNTSTSAATLFNSGATFGLTSSSSSLESNSVSSSNSTTSSLFGSSWQAPKSSPLSAPTLNSSSSSLSAVFAFGAPSTANSAASTPGLFGSPINTASSASPFSFNSPATSTQTQPVFGNPNPSFPFGSSPSGNGDQMTMEDSMAEDPVQASSTPAPVFGQQPSSSGFIFGSTAPVPGNQFGSATPPGANPFQFGGQATPVAPQNPSPFQASGSFNGGGSFSLGAGGDDKNNRRIVRVKRHQRKK